MVKPQNLLISAANALFSVLLLLPQVATAQGWRSMLGPGEVAKVHASVADDCDSCHVKFQGVPDQKCLEPCHSTLSAKIQTGKGFHAKVKEKSCITCHTDHKGAKGSLTTQAGFAKFDHEMTDFPLSIPHAPVACAKCHSQPLARMGLSCPRCHEDVHKQALGNNCTACHVDKGWKEDLRTKADHTLRQDGGHERLTCANCHAGGANLTKKAVCASCHTRAHGGTKAACDVCHTVAAWKPAGFSHSLCTCSFPAQHQSADCLSCHPKWRFTDTPTLCSGCHLKKRPHEDLGECSLCHQADNWKESQFSHNRQSTFALTGKHLRVDCQGCHPKGAVFADAPVECAGCHAKVGDDAHGTFAQPCPTCHSPEGWKLTAFDHATTGFPLTGQHGALACRNCHPDKAKDYPGDSKTKDPKKGASLPPVARPRSVLASLQMQLPPKPEAAHSETVSTCVHCHADPHGGQVSTECATCHLTTAWKPSTFLAANHAQTKFPLKGRHAGVSCASCHASEGATFFFKPAETRCFECHHDPHRKQLGKKCETCHSEEGFSPVPTFDHAVTGFRLERTHRAIGCGTCHTGTAPEALCGSCHLDPHAGQLGQDCAECHQADRFSLVRFDHDETGWPLRGRHFVTSCSDCHRNQVWVGLRTDCVDCHLQDAARGLAVVPGPFHLVGGSEPCSACHGLWSF